MLRFMEENCCIFCYNDMNIFAKILQKKNILQYFTSYSIMIYSIYSNRENITVYTIIIYHLYFESFTHIYFLFIPLV